MKATIRGNQGGGELAFVIDDNAVQVAAGTRQTKGRTVRLHKVIRNEAGSDMVLFTSTNAATAEVCTATVTYRKH